LHFCTAKIAIAGDIQQVVSRNRFDPVSWPELEVLRFVHGDDAVTDVEVFAKADQSPRDERERLVLRYGAEPLERCFPGRSTRDIEMEAPDVKLVDGVQWCNPLTMQYEVVGEAPPEYEMPGPAVAKQSFRRPGAQKAVGI
jgi:hypothetical protein